MPLDTVIFDIGHVIIMWHPERAFEQVMPAGEVAAFMERIGFAEWNRRNDARASIVPAEDELVRQFPADEAGIRGYRTHFLHTIQESVPGTAAVIAELAQAGVNISALTNWSADMFGIARGRFGILSRFSDIVVSGEEGIVKPHPEIFRVACRRLAIDPARAVFVDDSPANVVGAGEVGLTGVHFTSASQLRHELEELGLLGPREPIDEPVFHWALRADWDAAQAAGAYPWSTPGVDYHRAGFVHCAFAEQVPGVRADRFGDLPDSALVLLRVDVTPQTPVVVEQGYPHLFAPLALDAAAP